MEFVKDIQPWSTTIREGVIPSGLLQDMLNEALTHPSGDVSKPIDLANQINDKSLPVIDKFVNEILIPEGKRYIGDVFNVVPKDIDYRSWIRITTDGSGLLVHEHSNSHITCIVYLEGSDGDLVLQDPRLNAGRGYPSLIRKDNFKPMVFTPKAGRYLIFPSYLHHYVECHRASLRCVVTTDIFVKDTLDDN